MTESPVVVVVTVYADGSVNVWTPGDPPTPPPPDNPAEPGYDPAAPGA